ncbi:MAG: cyclase family protein [Planctomycetota bacterium]
MSDGFDITPTVSPRLGVWPGDTPASREVLCELSKGDSVTLSTLHATVHLGAHADAPNHYADGAESIEVRSLEPYLGPCQVVHTTVGRGQRLSRAHFTDEITEARVLFRTGTFPNPEEFTQDFAALEPELVTELAAEGVQLIGIDTPSVDLFPSKDLPAHAAFHAANLSILEGIVLTDVPAGRYELIALPLKLEGFDASPVRAILRQVAG